MMKNVNISEITEKKLINLKKSYKVRNGTNITFISIVAKLIAKAKIRDIE